MVENMIMVIFLVFVKLMEFIFVFHALILHLKMEKPKQKSILLTTLFAHC